MKTARVVLIAFVAGVLFVAGCGRSVTAPLPCTVARATSVDTIGWTIRATGDTVGAAIVFTCDPRIRFD